MSTAKKQLTTCPKKTAVAYARYSSAQQRDVSIEQQLNDIREYAAREGYTIIHEYADHAKSGFKNVDRRVEFQAMLAAAEVGAFDTVIAWKVDRFGRNRRESAIFKGQLADHGISVIYAMEPIPDGAAGVLTEGMLESLAEWYSRTIGENTKRGLHDNASKCMVVGPCAYGYKKSADSRYEIDEAEAAIVRRVFTYYSQGYSVESVVRMLNNEGIMTRKGQPFQRSSILSLLKNEIYIGIYHACGQNVPGGAPAIISRDLWDTCQFMRQKTHQYYFSSPEGYLLSRKCTCGYCNSYMYGNYSSSGNGPKDNKRRYYYYACRGKKEKRCSESSFIRKEVIEKPIIDSIFNGILRGPLLDKFIQMTVETLSYTRIESPRAQFEKEYKDVQKKIDNINTAISNGIWSESTGDMLRSLTRRSAELQKLISYHKMTDVKPISEDRIRFYFSKMAEGDYSNYEYLKTLVNSLINTVKVYKDWLLVVVNARTNVDRVPYDELPPLDQVPDISDFDSCSKRGPFLVTVEQYPVIIFKIPLKTA